MRIHLASIRMSTINKMSNNQCLGWQRKSLQRLVKQQQQHLVKVDEKQLCQMSKAIGKHDQHHRDIGNSSCDRQLSSFLGSLPTINSVFVTNQSINHKSTHCAGCFGDHKSSVRQYLPTKSFRFFQEVKTCWHFLQRGSENIQLLFC